MRRTMLAAIFILMLPAPCLTGEAATQVTIGIVADGPTARAMMSPAFLREEARNVLGTELEMKIPEEKRLHGNWTREGIPHRAE